MSKSNALVRNASFLMMATLISRVIGLLYRSPLNAIIGNVGLGYYGYANNVYLILLLISSYSIPMAVSKVISERHFFVCNSGCYAGIFSGAQYDDAYFHFSGAGTDCQCDCQCGSGMAVN